MMRLAFGVVSGRDQEVWDVRGRPVSDSPGSAVVVGPAGGDPRSSAAELARLVEVGGVAVAGAGIELSQGFRSARLDGAGGDRRDAVLAALKVLGVAGMSRFGERTGILVALFGPATTKRVAAAAGQAATDGRWPALQLASAASDLLGPEQLERLLALSTTPGQPDPMGRLTPSALAAHLARVLSPFPAPRRLELLLDLWDQVAAHQAELQREQRIMATQARQSRLPELTLRYRSHEDELLLDRVRMELGPDPSLAQVARWTPHWAHMLHRALDNALAATVLLRTAVAVAEHGVADGLARFRDQLVAAAARLDDQAAGRASRRVPGQCGLPARPGCYVRDLARRADPPEPYVRQRLARAREYGLVVLDAVPELLEAGSDRLGPWASTDLRRWREVVGYTATRPPRSWEQIPVAGQRESLARRLAAQPDAAPYLVEEAGDLLWYGELADAVARLRGHDAATVVHVGPEAPDVTFDPPPGEAAPLDPRLDSLPLAVAGAAQLVSLGARAPRRCRTWKELVDGLISDVDLAQALTGTFQVPEPLTAVDDQEVPGTGLRVELARGPRTLAEWSSYMGNCIASPFYVEEATAGKCGLLALRDRDGVIAVNVELRLAKRRWHVAEMKARFNTEPEPGVGEQVLRFVAGIAPPALPEQTPAPRIPGERLPARRPRNQAFLDLAEPLAALASQAMTAPSAAWAIRVLESLAGAAGGSGGPSSEVLVALRRMRPGRLTETCRTALAPMGQTSTGPASAGTASARPTSAGTASARLTSAATTSARQASAGAASPGPAARLSELWAATWVRPLAGAIEQLDPGLRDRYDQLGLLLVDAPLPGSLRGLARHRAIAPARTAELVVRRIRAAIGRLARAADPVLAQAIGRGADTDVLCALVIATTIWPLETVPVTEPAHTSVPGFPASTLSDENGPWHRALPAAAELGADLTTFWDRVATGGLRVPPSWLGHGGWPALWNRAARNSRRTGYTA
ncbi:hypothetical protein [Nonomuraea sp. NEAU-A123]|uniref:hypothetical protein n=1 Tax=Nonomuraea sp. NEAU-A123 TaxID=2839649 RepID=UPI001BE41CB4|nr:hypothetical protein [Nonomuraea sp. NEAU-A123]MBT2229034.1 hypothetical protein [Nonomuraea sp. NEAU-A123]